MVAGMRGPCSSGSATKFILMPSVVAMYVDCTSMGPKASALLKPEVQGEACMQVGPADYEAEWEKLLAASWEVPLEELVCFFGSEVLQFQR